VLVDAINSNNGMFIAKTDQGDEVVLSLNKRVILTNANDVMSTAGIADVVTSNEVIHAIYSLVTPASK